MTAVRRVILLVAAGVAWTAAWIVLDMLALGLIESGFNTNGLQQAMSGVLYLFGWGVIFVVWGLIEASRLVVRCSASRFGNPASRT